MTFLHASALVVRETGVLIRGPSGAGKSALTLALLEACAHRSLYGALIGDDRIGLTVAAGRLVAAGHPAIKGMIERRGFGIEPADHEPRALIGLVVDLVVDLAPTTPRVRIPDAAELVVDLETVLVPRMEFGGFMDRAEKISAVWSRIMRMERHGLTGAF